MRVLLPLIATIASAAFSAALVRQYLTRRRPHQLAWALSLAMFAIASAALTLGSSGRWTPVEFKTYFLFGALLNVPWLALGTIYLLARRAPARVCLIALLAFSAAAVVLVAGTHVSAGDVSFAAIPEPKAFLPFLPLRLMAALAGGLGTLVVVGGALVSGFAIRGDRALRSRFEGNLLIALGVLVAASGGTLAGLGRSQAQSLALAAGATIMFLGFRRASAPIRPVPARDPSR